MSKVTFRHVAQFDGSHVVEVWDGKEFIAGIYAGERAVRIISKHPMTETRDDAVPPAINIQIGTSQ
jgi:hypothetical protein